MAMSEHPLFTVTHEDPSRFCPIGGSAFISGVSVEDRSQHSTQWRHGAIDVCFIDVTNQRAFEIDLEINGAMQTMRLRSIRGMQSLWSQVPNRTIYLDITGLRHSTWAPILRSALNARLKVIVVYVEPGAYRPSMTPTEGEIYDLSERIDGIAPLPTFAFFGDPHSEFCFVPLFGFEGTRVAFLLEQVQPEANKVLPIIGLPGFLQDYPFATYIANRGPLKETLAWRNVKYAAANCPFTLFYALDAIAASYPRHVLRIAPIGTKPHAVGAVLFALSNPDRVELVYDHPIHRARRTEGVGRLLEYHVSNFVSA